MKIINRVVTHFHPHLDEYLAEYLALEYGGHKFHFMPEYHAEVVTTSMPQMGSMTDGILYLGVGGGPFDDHGEKAEWSCSELMCEHLRIDRDFRFHFLVRAVSLQDKNAGASKNRFNVPNAITMMQRFGYNESEIRSWVFEALDAIIDSEVNFLWQCQKDVEGLESRAAQKKELAAKFRKERPWFYLNLDNLMELIPEADRAAWREFPQKAFDAQQEAFDQALELARGSITSVLTRFGKVHLLIVDGSDGSYSDFESEIDKASRHPSVHADMVLMRNARGNTLIGVNRSARFNLKDLIRMIRIAEARSRDVFIPRHLQDREGTLEDFPQWHVHEGIGMKRMYNGTITRPDVEPSNLTFETIEDLVYRWLEVEKYSTMAREEDHGTQMAPALEGVEVEEN